MTEFCIVEFYFSGKPFYLIWCTDDNDYFFTNENSVVHFRQRNSVEKYCKEQAFDEPSFVSFDFDDIDYNNCNDYLNKWNIIDDLSKSLKIDFIGNHDEYTDLYSKFVYGSNIPALNTSGKKYVPTFTDEERRQIENLTHDMTRILKIALGLN